jgi:hypothetical protein
MKKYVMINNMQKIKYFYIILSLLSFCSFAYGQNYQDSVKAYLDKNDCKKAQVWYDLQIEFLPGSKHREDIKQLKTKIEECIDKKKSNTLRTHKSYVKDSTTEERTINQNIHDSIDQRTGLKVGNDYIRGNNNNSNNTNTTIIIVNPVTPAQDSVRTREQPKRGIRTTVKYPITYRILVPGVAQIHKGSKIKAGVIIAGQSSSIVGIIISYCLVPYYVEKFYAERKDLIKKQSYADKINFFTTTNKLSWYVAGSVYLYSFFDGCFAMGKRHSETKETSMNFLPYISPWGSGLTVALKF